MGLIENLPIGPKFGVGDSVQWEVKGILVTMYWLWSQRKKNSELIVQIPYVSVSL